MDNLEGMKTAISSISKDKLTHFRFLDLPAEIRNYIYSLCLTIPGGLILAPTGTPDGWKIKLGTIQNGILDLKLLLVSRQVSREATAILYGDNMLKFMNHGPELEDFISTIGDNVKQIQQIELSPSLSQVLEPALLMLREAGLLERLAIQSHLLDRPRRKELAVAEMLGDMLVPVVLALREARTGLVKKPVLEVLEFPGRGDDFAAAVKAKIAERLAETEA